MEFPAGHFLRRNVENHRVRLPALVVMAAIVFCVREPW
jgi:hypothetical protein